MLVVLVVLALGTLLAADKVKPLSEYPKLDRLWLGTDQGVVRPAGYHPYESTGEGFLQLHVEDGAQLKKDQVWATLNPKQLATEEKALELFERRLKIDLEDARRAARDEQAKRNLELNDLEKQKKVLFEASQSQELSAALRKRAQEAIEDIDEQLELARSRVTEERLDQEIDLRLGEIRLQVERQRNQFEMIKRRSQLVANFDGELRFADGLREQLEASKDKTATVWFNAGDNIATLVNEEHFEINIPNMTTATGGIPAKKLLAILHDGQSGRLINGDYVSSEESDRVGEIVRSYKFKVRERSIEDARKAMGQMNMVHIYRIFDEPIHLVFKKDIAFATPDILDKGGWVAVVRHLWEDAQVLQVGPQSIAIKAKP